MSEKKPGKDNFTRYLVIGVVVAVVAIMVVPTVISKTKSVSQEIPSTVTAENGYAIAFNTELTGVPVVDIYEDFQCPICQQFEGLNGKYINSLITDKKATVKFHTLSFIGPESVRAANAGACANDQGKFVDMHLALYANQSPSENSGAWTNDRLIEIGKASGISSSSFSDCVKNAKYQGWVGKVAEAGSKAGVNSTPTVFVNGKEIDRKSEYFSADKFKAAVERG
ncbi:DsbG Protein-disulfide isomerase [Candidatus Nanopelagicaceae bacterium]